MRDGRLASMLLVAVLAAGLVAVSAGAAPPASRPPGSPDLAALALAAFDLPAGTRVVRQRYYRDPMFVASYERELSVAGGRVGRSSLLSVLHDLSVEPDAAAASRTFRALATALRTKAFRATLASEIAEGAGVGAKDVTVGRPRRPRIGDGTISLPVNVRTQGLRLRMTIGFTQVDRVLAALTIIGFPARALRVVDVDRVARVAAEKIRAGLEPGLAKPPLVTGFPNPGQALTAVTGTWTGDQVAVSYQWERCVEPDRGCAPIPGATAATYTLVEGDLASTVRVVISGKNRLGSSTATSATTPFVVGPPGSPVVTEAPTITGSETLTATTGTWTGMPTSFAYQWRRCSLTTGACLDVPGATEEAYTVSASDSGSVLRVLVVARNDAGSGGALSPGPVAP